MLTVVALKSLLSIGLFHSPQNIMSQKHAEGFFFFTMDEERVAHDVI